MQAFRSALLLCLLLAAPSSWPREIHFTWWSDAPQVFLEAIQSSAPKALPTLPAGQLIRGGIVTHHFLASGLMVRFFAGLRAQTSPETIVLLGPNHFHHGLANISLSSLPWKTPFGVLDADAALVRRIGAAIHLPEDQDAFTGEHSVGVLIPFLKYYFPGSRVVPVLIDANADAGRLGALRDLLSEALKNPKVLVLLSMDFSHDSIASVADCRDQRTERVISAMDARNTEDLHVDCRKGLRVLLESLKAAGPVRVRINEHTNSARLTGRTHLTHVTSYFTIYFLGPA
jgi:AmmeMemoRadiSam system protein B